MITFSLEDIVWSIQYLCFSHVSYYQLNREGDVANNVLTTTPRLMHHSTRECQEKKLDYFKMYIIFAYEDRIVIPLSGLPQPFYYCSS